MKIQRISAYQVDLPLHEGSYQWSGGKSVAVFDSTIVRVETDEGVVGHGEVCPLGPVYLPAYAGGVRAGSARGTSSISIPYGLYTTLCGGAPRATSCSLMCFDTVTSAAAAANIRR